MDHRLRGQDRKVLCAAGSFGVATCLLAVLPAAAGFPGITYASIAQARAAHAGTAQGGAADTPMAAAASICASSSHLALAARLSRDILGVLRHRSSTVAVTVDDREHGVACGLRQGTHFDSASVVKVTISAHCCAGRWSSTGISPPRRSP